MRASRHPLLWVSILVTCAIALAVVALRDREQQNPGPIPNSTPPPATTDAEQPAPRQASVPPPARDLFRVDPDTTPRADRVELPDGTWVPALNGAKDARAPLWPEGVPYSPLVGRERASNGQDWYVHEDGTRWTTIYGWRADLGRMDAITNVATPTAPLPMEPPVPGPDPSGR
ncbi:MAG: hypothetical protein IPM29_05250 [Planctomycetes bacterium]|nr:hypothetical protein [Planctomycetota bacterium]